jgi:hypothetical protein
MVTLECRLPRLAEMFGPAEGAHLRRIRGGLVATQRMGLLAIEAGDAEAFGARLVALGAGDGDAASAARAGDARVR